MGMSIQETPKENNDCEFREKEVYFNQYVKFAIGRKTRPFKY